MSEALTIGTVHVLRAPDLHRVVDQACGRIAPSWPLDRAIAVNPLWGWVDRPMSEVGDALTAMTGARLTMPRAWYRAHWDAGRVRRDHLLEALAITGADVTEADVLAALTGPDPRLPVRARVTDVVDVGRDLEREEAWSRWVVTHVSQHCASWFDRGQAGLDGGREGGLYASWRRAARHDHRPRLLMGLVGFRERVAALPEQALPLIARALEGLEVPPARWSSYLTALLLDVGGWASVCAWRRGSRRREGGDDHAIVDLLAIRLAWEWILLQASDLRVATRWREACRAWPECDRRAAEASDVDWVLHEAFELATWSPLARGLGAAAAPTTTRPLAQVVCCIDVRSEPLRRALEAESPHGRTHGFAGFFGVPTRHRGVGVDATTDRAPGPLAPCWLVTDEVDDPGLAARRGRRLSRLGAWKALKQAALSGFALVESAGLAFGPRLVSDAVGLTRPAPAPGRAGLTEAEHAALRPRLDGPLADGAGALDDRVDAAARLLRGAFLTGRLARLVALVGHGSAGVNNPHAATLQCGACGGHAGDVSARVAAALLNDPEVRAGLRAQGVEVPEDTWFVPALHDTTTDEVALLDADLAPPGHAEDLARLRRWLDAAGARVRAERAPRLGLGHLEGAALHRALRRRARDWAEVRPEYGLAGNMAMVVAPRARTAHLDLDGRVFLHDYRAEEDPDGALLAGILTAPMLVAHWINLQYYAAVTAPDRFGSGDKLLHDVVGGGVGVLEGHGGDLRIGPSRQALHDGARWVHEPVRLGVFVEAPRAAVERVLRVHGEVRDLVENGWVALHHVDPDTWEVHRRVGARWRLVSA